MFMLIIFNKYGFISIKEIPRQCKHIEHWFRYGTLMLSLLQKTYNLSSLKHCLTEIADIMIFLNYPQQLF